MDDTERERWRKPARLSGAEMLLRTLLLEGVECVFGYPGGAVLYMYDAMHGNERFRHLLTRHEQGAIHAADGYARATGKTGVCIATSGPGATNLVTGIATAFMDSVPMVVITGNVASEFTGTDAFQEADIVGITMPITKHNFYVRRAEDVPRVLRDAFRIAASGRKGPVLVDIPKDVTAAVADFTYPDEAPPEPARLAPAAAAQLERLARRLDESSRPVVLAGGGVVAAEASAALVGFAERANVPVTTTLLGLGGFPGDHPLWLGMPGMHGAYTANTALQECDLLVSVGARFDDRVTMKLEAFAPGADIAHIDIDAAELGKLVPTAYPVAADAREALNWLQGRMKPSPRRDAWVRTLQERKRAFPLAYRDSETELKPQTVIRTIDRLTGGNAIVTTDVGQHQMWVAQYYRFLEPRTFLTSGGLGTMGFGFPSAIGAQLGRPDRVVVSINGDGGMQMCAQELAVCAIHRIPVKIAVINNGTLGMIRQWQKLIHEERYSQIDLSGSPDFVKLAEAYGVRGFRAETPKEAERAWKAALETDGPALVDFVVARDELVYPMVPQGNALHEMILGGEA
ncbi:biosynthetic-type acetolactate synthase large subunit [Paenibacillus sp.]|uniref:biosynthetic-type acetolactate synthase large subunit n=1 Tax=Paenibacillus sp. TaxID=58172 RepID=UPI002D6E12D6|nr:biosynthetic-type acetolactate synthase large subunit [Paenibacillus sp.]HZG56442.1 biosynthetic-type acetolactate synthase large subunit [Paenibacillus sp.]